MPRCECGCGGATTQGHSLPGHDQRLRTQLEAEIGGLLALRALVENARLYADGTTSEQVLGQAVRAIYADARLKWPPGPFSTTCREEVLNAAKAVMQKTGHDHFSVPEIVAYMQTKGTRYAESTIRTHVSSRMCANAPENHAVTYRDLMRTDRGEHVLLAGRRS